jgi:UDP-N-acetylmuramoyl-tripeptide--D-alanyl-D-alanine ligase
MMKNILSRYAPRYVRSLVYMLQASEYSVHDYLAWYHRSGDFTRIEVRKSLEKTAKAVALWISAWVILVAIYVAGIFLLLSAHFLFGVLIILAAPFLLAYLVLVPLCILELAQWPVTNFIAGRAKAKLKNHGAVKIAVAGSYGKTTMREILKTVLAEGKKVASPPHSYNTVLGTSRFVEGLKGDEEVLIFEFGESHVGDVAKLSELVQPDIGIITGVNEAHLEKFKTLDAAAGTIFELADWLQGKPLYVNAESELAAQRSPAGAVLYSRAGAGDWKVERAATGLGGTTFTLVGKNGHLSLSSSLLGLHQVGPLVAAVEIALELGLSQEEIQRGIASTKPFDHRLQPKTDSAGVVTLDDSYNGSPSGVTAVISFLSGLKGHRRFYVTPGLVEMGSRTREVHVAIGQQLAASGIEKVVLIRNSVTPYIEEGLRAGGFAGEAIWFDRALDAYAALPHVTVSGDVVLLQNDWPDQYA